MSNAQLPPSVRLYLAGPMTKHRDKDYNFRAFYTAAALLRMKGYEIVNPAELDILQGQAHWSPSEGRVSLSQYFTFADAMRRDGHELSDPRTHGIVLLPAWEDSVGARKELDMARLFGLKVYVYLGDGEIQRLKEENAQV